ncbi:MAG: pentapeptide repeat-containing protein [Myxococcota bacterium]
MLLAVGASAFALVGIAQAVRLAPALLTRHPSDAAIFPPRALSLHGADLKRRDLTHQNLRGADLRRANLNEADLDSAKLPASQIKSCLAVGTNPAQGTQVDLPFDRDTSSNDAWEVQRTRHGELRFRAKDNPVPRQCGGVQPRRQPGSSEVHRHRQSALDDCAPERWRAWRCLAAADEKTCLGDSPGEREDAQKAGKTTALANLIICSAQGTDKEHQQWRLEL